MLHHSVNDHRFGDYGALYKELLEDKNNNEEWHVWYPVDDHFPTDDELKGFKASTRCSTSSCAVYTMHVVAIKQS